jgi:hypothetical protein
MVMMRFDRRCVERLMPAQFTAFIVRSGSGKQIAMLICGVNVVDELKFGFGG